MATMYFIFPSKAEALSENDPCTDPSIDLDIDAETNNNVKTIGRLRF